MRIVSGVLVGFVAFLATMSPCDASQLGVYPTEVAITRNGTVVTLAYRVRVTNGEAAAVSGVTVDDYSGHTLLVGDIDAGQEGISEATQVTVDIGDWPSLSLMLPVTLHYTLQGQQADVNAGLGFSLPQ